MTAKRAGRGGTMLHLYRKFGEVLRRYDNGELTFDEIRAALQGLLEPLNQRSVAEVPELTRETTLKALGYQHPGQSIAQKLIVLGYIERSNTWLRKLGDFEYVTGDQLVEQIRNFGPARVLELTGFLAKAGIELGSKADFSDGVRLESDYHDKTPPSWLTLVPRPVFEELPLRWGGFVWDPELHHLELIGINSFGDLLRTPPAEVIAKLAEYAVNSPIQADRPLSQVGAEATATKLVQLLQDCFSRRLPSVSWK